MINKHHVIYEWHYSAPNGEIGDRLELRLYDDGTYVVCTFGYEDDDNKDMLRWFNQIEPSELIRLHEALSSQDGLEVSEEPLPKRATTDKVEKHKHPLGDYWCKDCDPLSDTDLPTIHSTDKVEPPKCQAWCCIDKASNRPKPAEQVEPEGLSEDHADSLADAIGVDPGDPKGDYQVEQVVEKCQDCEHTIELDGKLCSKHFEVVEKLE